MYDRELTDTVGSPNQANPKFMFTSAETAIMRMDTRGALNQYNLLPMSAVPK